VPINPHAKRRARPSSARAKLRDTLQTEQDPAPKNRVRALATTGRIGYVYPTGDRHALIVRNFSVNPSGEYADVPWTEPEDKGYSTQACSVNSRWGMFSELEYHVPAIGGGTGLSQIEDRSQLWAFRGQRRDIVKIARALLAADIQA